MENLMFNNCIVIGSVHAIDEIDKKINIDNYLVLENYYEQSKAKNTVYLSKEDLVKKTNVKVIEDNNEKNVINDISMNEMFASTSFNVELGKNKLSNHDWKSYVPLFYFYKNGSEVVIYSQLRFCQDEMIFIKTGDISIDELNSFKDLVLYAQKLHWDNTVFLGNHQCYYTKNDASHENEYKFNLHGENADPWVLINDIYNDIRDGKVNDYIFEFKDDFQKWDYMNYMFKIYGDETEEGYISFIPQTNGKYLIKRKIYKQDQLSRTEIHYKNVDVNMPLGEYIEKVFKVKYKEFPPFRRIRYDINIECKTTGNVHGIFFDYITIEGKEDILRQCEIEYLRTRSLFKNDEHMEELKFLKNYMEDFFKERNVEYENTFFSKLSFMERACK